MPEQGPEREKFLAGYELFLRKYLDAGNMGRLSDWIGNPQTQTTLAKFPEREVRILDLGAGRLALAANELAQRYPRLRVYAADLVVDPKLISNRADVTQSDGSHLPFSDNVFDFAYSYQLMSHISDSKKHMDILRELVRVLKPGATALLDDTLPVESLKRYISYPEAFFVNRNGNINEPGTVVFGGPSITTMIFKPEIDYGLFGVREKIIGHM